jgi:cyclohexyl-isocyanide hydratase
MDRRTITKALGAAVVGTTLASHRAFGADPPAATADDDHKFHPEAPNGKFAIGMLIFERMTNSDFVGPCDVLSRVSAAEVHVLAKTREPITTDARHRVLADMTLAEAPQLDMLFVPGGPGSTAMMEDEEVLAFLCDRAPRAQYVTSVCTGALVLGAAGLLRGYRAATHWTAMEVLPLLGAIPVDERVVIDRNRITGGGVTAGIDFGLVVVKKLWGDSLAQLIQLGQEYNPQPPFNAGSPRTAPAEVVEHFRAMSAKLTADRTAAAQRAAARFI